MHSWTKPQLRSRAKQTLAGLSPTDKKTQSETVCNKLLQYRDNYETRAVFLPLDYEPNISEFIRNLWGKNKIVLIPQIHEGSMKLAIYSEKSVVQKGSYGEYIIKDPQGYAGSLDVCLVPGLVFDIQGNRIGHGKGWYDRFLAQNGCFRIGVCYKQTIMQNIPYEEHDKKVDIVL